MTFTGGDIDPPMLFQDQRIILNSRFWISINIMMDSGIFWPNFKEKVISKFLTLLFYFRILIQPQSYLNLYLFTIY